MIVSAMTLIEIRWENYALPVEEDILVVKDMVNVRHMRCYVYPIMDLGEIATSAIWSSII